MKFNIRFFLPALAAAIMGCGAALVSSAEIAASKSQIKAPDPNVMRTEANAPVVKERRLETQLDGVNLLHLSHVHRGGGKLERPDNTIETFKWCWENGSALECDCRKTKDGVGIMLHDKTLKRTARGISPEMASRLVSEELTWDDIKDVDVGSYLKEINPAAADYSSNRIPTIEATFAAMKGHPTYLCFVDEKGAGPEYIAQKAREAGVLDQVYYTGQDYGKALDWNKATDGGKTLIWIGTWPRPKPEHNADDIARFEAHFEKKMDEMRSNGFKGVSAVSLHSYYNPKASEPFVPRASYLKKIIAEFHSHNIPVCSIPFEGGEKEEVYFKLFDLGCDGFSTDYPSVMFSVIRKLKAGKPSSAQAESVTLPVVREMTCDVLVVGVGPAGLSAAVCAARHGAKTILAERNGYLGGMATAGLVGPFMTATTPKGETQFIRGFFDEFVRLEEWGKNGEEWGGTPSALSFL